MRVVTETEMIDTQARVIRSLNLVHSADTQYMIGAVQLENLFRLRSENEVLKIAIRELREINEYIRDKNDRLQYGRTSK